MFKIGDLYIPFHAVTQIIIEEDFAHIWTAGERYFRVELQEDLERLRAWVKEQDIVALDAKGPYWLD